MKNCPKCGAPNDDSAETCKQCGCMLTPAETTSEAESWETIKKSTFPEHCIRCGEPLEGRYCKNCGADQLAENFVQSNMKKKKKKIKINIAMLIVVIIGLFVGTYIIFQGAYCLTDMTDKYYKSYVLSWYESWSSDSIDMIYESFGDMVRGFKYLMRELSFIIIAIGALIDVISLMNIRHIIKRKDS